MRSLKHTSTTMLRYQYDQLSAAMAHLARAFSWSGSVEGHDFWSDIYDNFYRKRCDVYLELNSLEEVDE